jgi:hypothetical protein
MTKLGRTELYLHSTIFPHAVHKDKVIPLPLPSQSPVSVLLACPECEKIQNENVSQEQQQSRNYLFQKLPLNRAEVKERVQLYPYFPLALRGLL